MTSPMVRGSSPLTRGKPESRFQLLSCRRLIPAHAGKTYLRLALMALIRAHPRSRGENRLVHWPTRSVMGSSPLTRGKRSGWPCPVARGRLIPAHAGKTMVRLGAYADALAHPRSRGENPYNLAHQPLETGSSPLTRGKPDRARDDADQSGLIPAHAGKTPHIRGWRFAAQAHPRSRGENSRSLR